MPTMTEYDIYEYVREAYRKINASSHTPLTEDLIITLVGKFGLDILKSTKLIGPTSCYGHYVLWCEA